MDQALTGNGRIYLNLHLLKQLREDRGWSQAKLASICFSNGLCVSLSSIKRAETGKKVLYRTALGLATVFQVSVKDLKRLDRQPCFLAVKSSKDKSAAMYQALSV